MNAVQYRQMLDNKRPPTTRPLFGNGIDGVLLRSAAKSLRRRHDVEKALEHDLPAEMLRTVWVDGFERGTLTLAAGDAITRERLKRELVSLRRQLARRVPGLISLRIVAGEPGE